MTSIPAERGPTWWADLHTWAEGIRQECSTCGEDAVRFASALHDVVNAKLGKQLQHPRDVLYLKMLLNETIPSNIEFQVIPDKGAYRVVLVDLDHSVEHPWGLYESRERADQEVQYWKDALKVRSSMNQNAFMQFVFTQDPEDEEEAMEEIVENMLQEVLSKVKENNHGTSRE